MVPELQKLCRRLASLALSAYRCDTSATPRATRQRPAAQLQGFVFVWG